MFRGRDAFPISMRSATYWQSERDVGHSPRGYFRDFCSQHFNVKSVMTLSLTLILTLNISKFFYVYVRGTSARWGGTFRRDVCIGPEAARLHGCTDCRHTVTTSKATTCLFAVVLAERHFLGELAAVDHERLRRRHGTDRVWVLLAQ